MKERTRVFFELAEQDLSVAGEIIDTAPNLAAFHAQQAAEKSLKAMVTELSKDADEDYLRKRLRHDTIKAVLRVLTETIKDVSRRSGYYGLHAKLERQKDTADGKLAILLYYSFSRAFDTFFDLFEEMPISESVEDYWEKSLEADLKPNPSFNRKWEEGLKGVGEVIDTFWGLMAPIFKIEGNLSLREALSDEKRFKRSLEGAYTRLQSEGLDSQASSVQRAIRELEMLANPESSFLQWMKIVVAWTPYLDAHAIFGRYPSQKQLRKYANGKDGVRNLIRVSQEISQKSKAALVVLSS